MDKLEEVCVCGGGGGCAKKGYFGLLKGTKLSAMSIVSITCNLHVNVNGGIKCRIPVFFVEFFHRLVAPGPLQRRRIVGMQPNIACYAKLLKGAARHIQQTFFSTC